MLAELRYAIAQAVLSGAGLNAIEEQIINRAPIDPEHKSALWLYAEAITDRPARLIIPDPDFVSVERSCPRSRT
jgi:hypothetical protein